MIFCCDFVDYNYNAMVFTICHWNSANINGSSSSDKHWKIENSHMFCHILPTQRIQDLRKSHRKSQPPYSLCILSNPFFQFINEFASNRLFSIRIARTFSKKKKEKKTFPFRKLSLCTGHSIALWLKVWSHSPLFVSSKKKGRSVWIRLYWLFRA